MGSANKTGSSADRRARIEEMRRAERARERRNRIVTVAASVVVVAGLAVGGVVLLQSQSGDKASAASDDKGSGGFVTGADGVKTWKGTLGRTHTGKTVSYPMEPPVGGDHNPVWQNCNGDVYTKPVNNMNAVHSLEHGAVWVTYSSKAPKADVDALTAKVRKTPYTLMSPVEDQKDPIMLSAWAHQRTVKSASDPAVDAFFAQFVQGSQTPEPGAACTGGLGQ
ncbi:DUF3105 domain-containing protein [Streptomyces sp. NPDC093228]|jgi:hypothetical protein|uniref:DUF3105 domain-containing protein n=1 Tax=unclassified Streptomyces TaxID=2593676 RepID=UPI0007410827|nr:MULTISPECIES: DUF3105 domain-containing protein [unclassified Streptomyces]KUJ58571.1 hypothetical protein ADL25_02865 [Streptomyces sp. NRRL F-5122]MDX3257689.1 DUF3105 domain-containing protein [Streptomyces sp. MI02-2A]REE60297.1 uncharacterized protein DUF3105 [Streptomyces sp. 3212.3]